MEPMKAQLNIRSKAMLLVAVIAMMTISSSRMHADTGTCGGASITLPFSDVLSSNIYFCAIAEAYFSALTNGTSSTTYSPSDPVAREQMAAFVTRTLDQSINRGSKRAALDQFWTTQEANNLSMTTVGTFPVLVESDGADLWVVNAGSGTASRVRASDGGLLETWTGATVAAAVLVAIGKIFIVGQTDPGKLYQIDPTQAPGAVATLSSTLGSDPTGIAYDGKRIWTANNGASLGTGSVSIISSNPISVTTVTPGFSNPVGILYDGANIWVADSGDDTLKRLDPTGGILQSVAVGSLPRYPAFDGTNIWMPNQGSDTVSVVRASSGVVLATLNGNGLSSPTQAAFNGERILVTNRFGGSVSLWKAADLTPVGTLSTGPNTRPIGACSDGLNFWIALNLAGKLARF
jgi:DNA-binding beta-propeller fold protein YncE